MLSFSFLNESISDSSDSRLVIDELFEHAFDGFEVIDTAKDKVVEINQKLLDLLGIDKEDVLGQSPRTLIRNQTVENDKEFSNKIIEGIKQNGSYVYRRQHRRKDNVLLHLEVSSFALSAPNEHVIVSIFKDVTKEEIALKGLRESEKRFRLIFDNAFDGLYFFNYKTSELVLGNSRLFELFETTPARILIDKPHLTPEVQPDGEFTIEKIKRGLQETLATGRSRNHRVYYKKDGTEVNLEISTFLLSPPDDDIVVSIYKDISDQILAERAMLENASQRQKMDAMKRELTSFALFTTQKNKLLQELSSDAKDLRSLDGDTLKFGLEKIIKKISNNLNDSENWLSFKLQFERVHPGFFNNLRLKFGDLSSNDQKHCAYIKMNLSNGEIADLLFVGKKAIEMSHYRIKKRLGLPKETTLKAALAEL